MTSLFSKDGAWNWKKNERGMSNVSCSVANVCWAKANRNPDVPNQACGKRDVRKINTCVKWRGKHTHMQVASHPRGRVSVDFQL